MTNYSTFIIYKYFEELTKFHVDIQMVLDETFGKQCQFTNKLSAMIRFQKIKKSESTNGFIGIIEIDDNIFKIVLKDGNKMTRDDRVLFVEGRDYNSENESDEEIVVPIGIIWEIFEELENSKKLIITVNK